MDAQQFWKIKLSALLHDPPHKTFLRIKKGEKNHESVAKDLLKKLIGEDLPKDLALTGADRIASAMSRLLVEGTPWKPNYEDLKFIDPYTLRSENVVDVDETEIDDFFSANGFFHNLPQDSKYKYAFLYCWRLMPEKFSSWLLTQPADDRATNHSIYDHMVQTSAIAGTLPQPSLFIFTISDVQNFIATSRKTQDLWSASYLLSYLLWNAMRPIVEDFGPDSIIYPNLLRQPLVDLLLKEHFQQLGENEPFIQQILKILSANTTPDKLSIANFPNVFFAILPYNEVKRIAQKSEEKIEETLKEIGKKVWNGVFAPYSSPHSKSVFDRHLQDFPLIYWVALPWALSCICGSGEKVGEEFIKEYENLFKETDLSKSIKQIEYSSSNSRSKFFNLGTTYSLFYEVGKAFLRARKNIRDFQQTEEKGRYRCSICGVRSELSVESQAEKADAFWKKIRNRFPGLLREGERLCGLCALKRFAPSTYFKDILGFEPSFPSTPEISATTLKDLLNESKTANIREDFLKFYGCFKSMLEKLGCSLAVVKPVAKLKDNPLGNIDGQWLMEESYRADYIASEYGGDKDKIEEFLENIREQWEELFGKLRSYGSPSRYYAILFMDGDEIGKWIAGVNMPKVRELLEPSYLCQKASQLPPILDERHPVSPSLHQLLSRKMSEFALNDVRCVIEQNYGALVYAGGDDVLALLPIEYLLQCLFYIRERWRKRLGRVTISAGVAIVHCRMPLSRALREGREALRLAKEKYDRDAFCLSVLPRGGERREGGSKWQISDGRASFPVPCILKELADGFRAEKLSGRFPYQFAQVQREIGDDRDVLERELTRIYERKEAAEPQLLEKLKLLLQNVTVESFTNLLLISHFIGTRGCYKK